MQVNKAAGSAEVGAWEEARSRDSVVLLCAFAFFWQAAPRERGQVLGVCACVSFFVRAAASGGDRVAGLAFFVCGFSLCVLFVSPPLFIFLRFRGEERQEEESPTLRLQTA